MFAVKRQKLKLPLTRRPVDGPASTNDNSLCASLAIVSALSKGSPRQKTPTQSRSQKRLLATLQEAPGKRMARATQHPERELTLKWSPARTAVSGTRIQPSGNRLGCNDCRRIAARGYGKIVRE